MIFLRINLPKFVQFKQYIRQIGTTRYFVQSKIFHYCDYKHFKHWYVNGLKKSSKI